MGITIIVTGGREYSDPSQMWRVLDHVDKFLAPGGVERVVEGASDDVTGPYIGADYWAHQWALARNKDWARCHAKWKEQGRAAGPIRNGVMLSDHEPGLVVEFPGGKGTANMVSQAEKAGVQVIKVADLVYAAGVPA